jgi:hypothetical protein
MRVGGVTSTPVVTFLVEDVLGAAALTPKAASASGNPGRGADTPGKFCLLVLLSEGMIGVLVVATGLSGLERVYGLSVQPVILDTAVQSGFFQLYVQPTAEPGRIAPDFVQILAKVDNITINELNFVHAIVDSGELDHIINCKRLFKSLVKRRA